MKKVFVLGSGQCAEHTLDILESRQDFEVVGLLDPFRDIGDETLGYPVLGTYPDLPLLAEKHGTCRGIIAIGDGWVRRQVLDEVREAAPMFELISAIHASAIISPRAHIGPGAMISPGASLGAGVELGTSCLIGINAFLSERVELGDFSMVSSGSGIGDRVRLGEFTAITIGVTVVDRVEIGAHTVVGAGATVLRNLPDRVVAYGSPAKVVRPRSTGEPFLDAGPRRGSDAPREVDVHCPPPKP